MPQLLPLVSPIMYGRLDRLNEDAGVDGEGFVAADVGVVEGEGGGAG